MHAEPRVTEPLREDSARASSPMVHVGMSHERHCGLRPPTPKPRHGARLRVMTPLLLTTLMLVQTVTILRPGRATWSTTTRHQSRRPLRWLEDVESPETRSWVEAENRVTFAYLEQIPERERIRRRLTELWTIRNTAPPSRRAAAISSSRIRDWQKPVGALHAAAR